MLIENIMYFALGVLAAGLVALVIMPAVWKRAVRLTKRRIEAATPITMAEFRADKDQLRAEFALSTRRLEMNVETLRQRLAEQLSEIDRKRIDLGTLQGERNQHLGVVAELEAREAELRVRVAELERDGTELVQRLQGREHELLARSEELNAIRLDLPQGTDVEAENLSGDYDQDIDRLRIGLAIERKRAAFLEVQARSLLAKLENSDRHSSDANAAIDQLRAVLSQQEDAKATDAANLVTAEARIASAENRLNAILAETSQTVQKTEGRPSQSLADRLSLDDELDALRAKVDGVESTIAADWGSERADEAQLRIRLNDIATSVSRLVYSVESEPPTTGAEESLFDRVQRFAGDDDTPPKAPPPAKR